MKITGKHWALGLAGAALFASGIAYAQTSLDRYNEVSDLLTKAQAVLNAVQPANSSEQRQHDKAVTALANAQSDIACARLRSENKKAVCQ